MGLILDSTSQLALDIHTQFGWATHAYDGKIFSPPVPQSRTTVRVNLNTIPMDATDVQRDGGLHGTGALTLSVEHPDRLTALDASENLMRWVSGRSLADGAAFVSVSSWTEQEADDIEGRFGAGYTTVLIEDPSPCRSRRTTRKRTCSG